MKFYAYLAMYRRMSAGNAAAQNTLCEKHTISGLCGKLQSPIVRLADCLPDEPNTKEKVISSLFSSSCSSLGLATILFSTLRMIIIYP